MNNLGVAYVVGSYGLPQDREQALFWLMKAADQRHCERSVCSWICAMSGGKMNQVGFQTAEKV